MAIIAAAAPLCLGVDTNTKLTASTARALAEAEYTPRGLDARERVLGVARYVGIRQHNAGDIDGEELADITAAGLGCWLVQHVRATQGHGWVPSGPDGKSDGTFAAQDARAAGYPQGAHLVLDLEDVRPGTSFQEVIAHCNEWADAVAASYQPCLYVGFSCGLSPDQLYMLPDFHLYWSDFSNRRVSNRGCAIVQFDPNRLLAGVTVDMDRVGVDMLGGRLTWAVEAYVA